MLARRLLDAWLWFVIAVIALVFSIAALGLAAGIFILVRDTLQ